MAKLALIYAYWPSQPFGITWCDLPWAIRNAGLPKTLSDAGHEITETMLMPEDDPPEDLRAGFRIGRDIAAAVQKARAFGELPVVLTGSCSIAAPAVIAGIGGAGTAIAWFDTHPDLHTAETTETGLFEGMALAIATGSAWQAMAQQFLKLEPASLDAAALFGARDIDTAERDIITERGLLVTQDAADLAQHTSAAERVYLHVDMDVHDPSAFAANLYEVPGGPSVDDVRAALTSVDNVAALSITSLDPAVDESGDAVRAAIGHVLAVADHLGND